VTPPPLSPWRYLLYAAGSAMIGYGLWGQLYGDDTKPVRVAALVVVAALVHDLVLAPAVLLLAVVLRRLLPRWVGSRTQGAALIGFCLFLVAIPGLGRYGVREDNPSVLPRDYTEGLLLALAVVVLGTVLSAVVAKVRRRR
jgi:hypothetical protein